MICLMLPLSRAGQSHTADRLFNNASRQSRIYSMCLSGAVSCKPFRRILPQLKRLSVCHKDNAVAVTGGFAAPQFFHLRRGQVRRHKEPAKMQAFVSTRCGWLSSIRHQVTAQFIFKCGAHFSNSTIWHMERRGVDAHEKVGRKLSEKGKSPAEDVKFS